MKWEKYTLKTKYTYHFVEYFIMEKYFQSLKFNFHAFHVVLGHLAPLFLFLKWVLSTHNASPLTFEWTWIEIESFQCDIWMANKIKL